MFCEIHKTTELMRSEGATVDGGYSRDEISPEHDEAVRHHVRDTVVQRRVRVLGHDVLEHQNRLPLSSACPRPISSVHFSRSLSTDPHLLATERVTTHHTPGQAAGHEREAQEQHQPRLPRHAGPAVAVVVGTQTRLLDAVDDHHAEGGADARDPVDELHVHIAAVARAVRVGGRIDEAEETDGELSRDTIISSNHATGVVGGRGTSGKCNGGS